MSEETPAAQADEVYCQNCGSAIKRDARFCPKCGAGVSADVSAATTTGQEFDHQVTGRRIVAALIDIVLLGILFLVMAAAWGDFGSTDDSGFNVSLENGPFLIYALLVYGYYTLFEGLVAMTVGKMVMGLKVVKLNGEAYGLGPALLRNILRVVDGLPFLYLVGLISVAVTKRNQRIGDLAAGTAVVRAV